MPLRFIVLRLPLLAGCLLVVAPRARAQSGVSVNVSSNSTEYNTFGAGVFGPVTSSRSDQKSDPVSATTSVYSFESSNQVIANATGNSAASAHIGQVNISLSANEVGDGATDCQSTARWSNTLLITSATLPLGTPAQLTLTAHYVGSFTSNFLRSGFPVNYLNGFLLANLNSSANIAGGSAVSLNYSGASQYPAQAGDPALPMDITLTGTLDAQVGQTFSLSSSAQLMASVSGGFKETSTEAGNLTATFGATPVNSAITLTQVPAATPEPFAMSLLGSGLLTGFCLVRRRKS